MLLQMAQPPAPHQLLPLPFCSSASPWRSLPKPAAPKQEVCSPRHRHLRRLTRSLKPRPSCRLRMPRRSALRRRETYCTRRTSRQPARESHLRRKRRRTSCGGEEAEVGTQRRGRSEGEERSLVRRRPMGDQELSIGGDLQIESTRMSINEANGTRQGRTLTIIGVRITVEAFIDLFSHPVRSHQLHELRP